MSQFDHLYHKVLSDPQFRRELVAEPEQALRSGSEIPPFYDSMIAKIIASGSNREEARSRLICGLEQTVAFGVTTNQSFLMSCLRHPAFA